MFVSICINNMNACIFDFESLYGREGWAFAGRKAIGIASIIAMRVDAGQLVASMYGSG